MGYMDSSQEDLIDRKEESINPCRFFYDFNFLMIIIPLNGLQKTNALPVIPAGQLHIGT